MRIEPRLHGPELLKRDKFVEHQARPEQVPDGPAVVKLDAEQPGNRREHVTENLFQRRVEIAEHTVAQGDQRKKCNQHGGDVQHQLAGPPAKNGIVDARRRFNGHGRR